MPCKSNAEEVSFEWSHHRILSTDSKARTKLRVSIIDSGSEGVKERVCVNTSHLLEGNRGNNFSDNICTGLTFLISSKSATRK